MLAATITTVPAEDALDLAHGSLVVTASEVFDLVQEEVSDTGLARIARLIEQMCYDFARTVEAHERRKVL